MENLFGPKQMCSDPQKNEKKGGEKVKESNKGNRKEKNGKLPFIPNLDFGRPENDNWWSTFLPGCQMS